MRYRIGDVEKIMGITPVTTRFFEEQGIIESQRDAKSNYRYYDALNINKLFCYKIFRRLDFSLQQSMHLISGDTIEHKGDAMRAQLRAVQEKRAQLLRAERRIEYYIRLVKRTEHCLNRLVEMPMPQILFVKNQAQDEFLINDAMREANQLCFERIEACLTMFGYSLGQEDAIAFGYGAVNEIGFPEALLNHGELIGARPCLNAIVRLAPGATWDELLHPLLSDYAGPAITGEVYGHVFHGEKIEDDMHWYGEIFLPLK